MGHKQCWRRNSLLTKMLSQLGILLFSPILLVQSLDLQAALSQGKFSKFSEDMEITLEPSRNPAINLYYDNSLDEYQDQITLKFVGEFVDDEEYKLGLSLLILIFDTDNGTTFMNVTGVNDITESINYAFRSDIELPSSTIEEKNIIRTWQDLPEVHYGSQELRVKINKVTPRTQIYLVATSYKVSRTVTGRDQCEPYRPLKTPDWWNCNVNEKHLPLICVNYDLTCDNIPHCAHTEIPNPDENCDQGYGLKQALQLLIYTLITVCVVMFVAGCARCCLRGTFHRRLMRRGSDFEEILSQSQREPVRPDNAPPTYDDAMKYVNDAFTADESDDNEGNEEEDPPSYSPQPREGEHIGFPPTPPCNCARLEEEEENRVRRQEEALTSEEGAVGFSNNFANIDPASLPRGPPPYTR